MSTSDALALGLTFAVVGMVVVFTVLATIALLISVMHRWSDALDAKAASATPTTPPSGAGEIDGQTLAVIAAAATVAVNRPVRVRDVRVSE